MSTSGGPESPPSQESQELDAKLKEVAALVRKDAKPLFLLVRGIRKQLLPRALIGEALEAERHYMTVSNIAASYGDKFMGGTAAAHLSHMRTDAARLGQNDLRPRTLMYAYVEERIGQAAAEKLFEIAKELVAKAPPDAEGGRKIIKRTREGGNLPRDTMPKRNLLSRPDVGPTNTIAEVEQAAENNAQYAAFLLDAFRRAEVNGGGWREIAANAFVPEKAVGDMIRKHGSLINTMEWLSKK